MRDVRSALPYGAGGGTLTGTVTVRVVVVVFVVDVVDLEPLVEPASDVVVAVSSMAMDVVATGSNGTVVVLVMTFRSGLLSLFPGLKIDEMAEAEPLNAFG